MGKMMNHKMLGALLSGQPVKKRNETIDCRSQCKPVYSRLCISQLVLTGRLLVSMKNEEDTV
jgi:hypothetical protein